MQLPITREQAEKDWRGFEEYLIRERYSIRDPETGEPIEKTYADVINRVANCFSDKNVAAALREKKIITATPALMNLGNEHTGRGGLYSCFPLGPVEDSTKEIFEVERKLVTIFQHSGGAGLDVSQLRRKGSPVDNKQGSASGPVSFVKGFSHLSERISQGGKRRGAMLAQMDYTHPDIEEFVTFKGDSKGVYTGINVSVNITDDKFWGDTELIDLIAKYMYAAGDPGLLFTERSIKNTPVPSTYNPRWVNPCSEYVSIKDTACNLLSVNLQKCLKPEIGAFLCEVVRMAEYAAIAGNEILDMGGFPPIPEIKEATLKHRPIGIGFTGLHAATVSSGIDYRSGDAIRFARDVQAAIMIGSMQGSLKYGRHNALGIISWDQEYIEQLRLTFNNSGLHEVLILKGNPLLYTVAENGGLYNCVTTSQAPTGSTSQLLHVSSTGIEPYFSMVQNRRVRTADGGWKEFTLVPLEFYDYDEAKLDWIAEQTAHHINPEQQIKILEAVQDFCHTGVSKTINMPASTTVEDVKAIIMRAKDSNLKGLTIFRDSSMEGVLSDATVEVSGPDMFKIRAAIKANTEDYAKQWDAAERTDPEIPTIKSRRFGDIPDRKGTTYKFSGPSSLYITANFGDRGDVMEIFIVSTKPGSTVHAMCSALGRAVSVGLQFGEGVRERMIKTLSDISSDGVWMNAVLGRVYSIPAAVARVLNFHSGQEEDLEEGPEFPDGEYAEGWEERSGQTMHCGETEDFISDRIQVCEEASAKLDEIRGRMADSSYSDCPTCGKMALRRDGGCSKCVECGYTSC